MGQRPPHVRAPDYLSKSPPLPEPADPAAQGHGVQQADPEVGPPETLDPTRYGDWERKGIAVDF